MKVANIINPENVSLFVAAVALLVAFFSFKNQRRHNRLSVKPQITLKHVWDCRQRSVIINNLGLGPAIIDSVKIFHNEKQLQSGTIEEIVELADSVLGEGFYSHGEPIDQTTVIDKGQEINLLTLSFHEQHEFNEARQKIFDFLRNSFVEIKYKSIYEESFNAKLNLYSNIDHRIA